MKSIREEKRLLEILKKYSPSHMDYADIIIESEEKSTHRDVIVPVLGMQGVGKSTFLNAILGEDLLPTESDETTCVPVEIRYGLENKATIYFKDKSSKTIEDNKAELAKFVDNNYNNGNELSVAKIVVYRNTILLKKGLVLVDLPGVGSLTIANSETTRDYIKDLAATIFLIPAPILKTNANYISLVWRGFNSVYFVQNNWNECSETENQEGLQHNTKVLHDIATKIKSKMIDDIIPINAYLAAKGSFIHNKEDIAKSNLPVLMEKLQNFAENYREISDRNFKAKASGFINAVVLAIEEKIKEASLSKMELLKKIKNEENEIKKQNNKLEEDIYDIEVVMRATSRNTKAFISDIARKYSDLLKADIFHYIDNGNVDGEKLDEAFQGYQTQYNNELMDEFIIFFEEEVKQLEEKLEKTHTTFNTDIKPEVDAFIKAKSIKFEDGIDVVRRIASGVVGWKAGAAVGTYIGGPVGAVVGAIVGVIVGWGIDKIGKVPTDMVRQKRINKTKKQIEPHIYNYKKKWEETLNDSFKTYSDGVKNEIEAFRSVRRESLQIVQSRIDDIIQEKEELLCNVQQIQDDLDYLNKYWREDKNEKT